MEAFSHQRAARRSAFRARAWACRALGFLFSTGFPAAEGPAVTVRRQGSAEVGVALAAELVADAGDLCPEGATTPCILRSGGGMGIRVGYRAPGRWFVGGA